MGILGSMGVPMSMGMGLPMGRGKPIEVIEFGNMRWTDLSAAFRSCGNLTSFSGGDVSSVTDMSDMFSGTSSLEQLDTSNWDFGSVTTAAPSRCS